MNHSYHQQQEKTNHNPWYTSLGATGWVAIAGIVISVMFYLIMRHQVHVVDALPYLFLAAMLLMHLGHGGHGGHNHSGSKKQ